MVHCWNESHLQTVCHSEVMHQMVKSHYMATDGPIKAHCLFVQVSKRILVRLENHTVKCCSLPKGSVCQVLITVQLKLFWEYCKANVQTSWWQKCLSWRDLLEMGLIIQMKIIIFCVRWLSDKQLVSSQFFRYWGKKIESTEIWGIDTNGLIKINLNQLWMIFTETYLYLYN